MTTDSDITVRLVRNATVLVTISDTTFLVDPMFASPGDMPSVGDHPAVPDSLETPTDRENPLVPMPDIDLSHDAIVVTHRHPDHFDEAAKEELEPDVPLFCQPEEADAFADEGFTDVRPVDEKVSFDDITIHRTPGRHGHGKLAEGMGPVSGFVFEGENDETLYLAGDTIWYEPVEQTLEQFEPDMVVLNGGEAQFEQGEPITMGIEDISAVRNATDATVAVVHMEAINHCLLSRDELRSKTEDVFVPEDGEHIQASQSNARRGRSGSGLERTAFSPFEEQGFSQAVSINEPTHKRVFIAGTIAVDGDGSIVGEDDMEAQTRHIFDQFEEYLEELGGDLDDLVRVRVYVTTMDEDALEGYRRGRDGRDHFYDDPEHYPASSMVKVDSLVLDEAMVEIDAEAIIPDNGWDTTARGQSEWPYSG
jgi:L-ascorbate metabolism protein UlaG (beta-lactamase superfamily)